MFKQKLNLSCTRILFLAAVGILGGVHSSSAEEAFDVPPPVTPLFGEKSQETLVAAEPATIQLTDGPGVQSDSIPGSTDILHRLNNLESRLSYQEQTQRPSTTSVVQPVAPSWYVGAEAVFLRAANSDGDFNPIRRLAPGIRYWAGVQTESGLGARLRFFDYHQGNPNSNNLSIQNYDIEATDRLRIANWDILLNGGVRFTEFSSFIGKSGYGAFRGYGPTIGVQLIRPIVNDFALFASVQESILMGTSSYGSFHPRIPSQVSEMQLGLQFNRGGYLIRGGFEGQSYSNIADSYSENAGLIGFFTSFGLQF